MWRGWGEEGGNGDTYKPNGVYYQKDNFRGGSHSLTAVHFAVSVFVEERHGEHEEKNRLIVRA